MATSEKIKKLFGHALKANVQFVKKNYCMNTIMKTFHC